MKEECQECGSHHHVTKDCKEVDPTTVKVVQDKCIMIVLRETKDGFSMGLEGDVTNLNNGTPHGQLSPVEQWAAAMFNQCGLVLKSNGAKKTTNPYAGGRR